MKKKNYSVMGLVQKAIIDSMNFSKVGEKQIFISAQPHVDGVYFHAYPGAWNTGEERVFDFHIYTRGSLAPTVKECKKMLKPLYDFIKQNSKTDKV